MVTLCSSGAKTQKVYFFLRKCNRGLRKDYKIIASENLTTQHKLLAIDLKIKRKLNKRDLYDRPRIR